MHVLFQVENQYVCVDFLGRVLIREEAFQRTNMVFLSIFGNDKIFTKVICLLNGRQDLDLMMNCYDILSS